MIGGNLALGIGWWGANQSGSSSGKSCGKFLWEILAGNSCRKFLWEILAGNGGGEKANLRKAVIGGNLPFGIGWWGANQSGSSSGKSFGKILQEILVGNCCGKILRENLVGNSCGKFLWENLAGNSYGKWRRGKSQFKKGSDWWKFSIWNRVMGSQPISIQLRKILQENLAGNCCGKILREILVGKSCGQFLRENLAGNSCGKFLWEMEEGKNPI